MSYTYIQESTMTRINPFITTATALVIHTRALHTRALDTYLATRTRDARDAMRRAKAARDMIREASERDFAAFVTLRLGEHVAVRVTVAAWASRVLRRTSRTANTNGGA